jgi:hypothetical protein
VNRVNIVLKTSEATGQNEEKFELVDLEKENWADFNK